MTGRKFIGRFLAEQKEIMDKFESALCNYHIPDKNIRKQCLIDFKAGELAAAQNYTAALTEIENLSKTIDELTDYGSRAIEAERKVENLHKIIEKQQLKIQRQAENISTLLDLYTGGEQSRAHEKLKEKYEYLKKIYAVEVKEGGNE